MGGVHSKYPELDRLEFEKFPTRPISGLRVVRAGSIVVGWRGEGHRIYTTNKRLGRNFSFMLAEWPWLEELLRALIRLGVIPKEVAERHTRMAEKAERRRDAAYILERLPEELARHRVQLTQAQIRKLRKATKAT